MSKTILISISRGFVVRDLVISGMVQTLRELPIKVILLTHTNHCEELRAYVKEMKNVEVVTYPPVPLEVGTIERQLIDASYKLFEWTPCVNALARLNDLFSNFFPTHFFDKIFDEHCPDLVLCGTPGYHSTVDSHFIREAKRRHIPTLSVVPSWDNLFTRGILPAFPDRLAVWNEQIKSDYIRVYRLPTGSVEVNGPLQFDFYFDESIYVPRSVFFRENGFDENKKLITIALSRSDIYGRPDHFLSVIEKACKENAFVKPVQFVCRLHPFDEQMSKESLRHFHFFHIEHFNRRSASFGWCPDPMEIRHKANLLRHSDIIINYYSTLGIEGVVSDTPVIQIEFHHEQSKKFERFRNRVYKRHFRYLKDTTAIRTVRSEKELIDWVNRYLEYPEQDAEARKELAKRFCFRLDGKAHERLAQLAQEIVFNGREQR